MQAYFYTRDLARAWRVAEALEYGMIGLNGRLLGWRVRARGGGRGGGIMA